MLTWEVIGHLQREGFHRNGPGDDRVQQAFETSKYSISLRAMDARACILSKR